MALAGDSVWVWAVSWNRRKITHHQLKIIKQKFTYAVQQLLANNGLCRFLYLGRHGLLKGDLRLHPNAPWGLQHRPDLLLNHVVLFKEINS